MLGLHAVIGRDDDGGTHCVKLLQISVEHPVKRLRFGIVGGIFMLYVIGGGQIHDVW